MKLKTALTSPGPNIIRSFSNNSSSSNSVIMHHSNTAKPQHSAPILFKSNLSTLETDIYRQRYDDTNDNDDDDNDDETEEADGSNFLDMNDDEADIERLLDNLPPSPPSSPPRELLPDRLYALYDFQGPDPNHLELQRNDPVELLNDEDNYWWLVKNLNNFKVGFVPAEFLENFEERLARLNCWKNEQHEKSSKQDLMENLDDQHLIIVNGDKLIDFNKVELKDKRQKVSFDIKEETTRSEILSEIYSDYTPLVINKTKSSSSYLSNQNFLVKSLDDYDIPIAPPPPQQIFKEDSIGSFSSDTDTSPNSNISNRIRFQNEEEQEEDVDDDERVNLSNSIQLLDDYIKEQTLVEEEKVATEEDEDNTLRDDDDDDESATSSNNSLIRNHTTTTPLTSESYLNNDSFMKVVVDPKRKYHPFVHELFDDLIKEIEILSSSIQQSHL